MHDIAFRYGKIHGSQGNEMVHANSGATDRFYGLSFEHVEFADGPWSVPNGSSSTSGTGNANTNQVSKMWPPPNHRPKWSNTYNTHWSPLGGGGLTSGAMILNTPNNVVRNCYFHDVGLISFHENPNNMGNIFENNLVDFGLLEYADAGVWYLNGVQMAGFHPPLPVDYCVDGADRCSGYTGSFGVTMRTRSASPNQNGNIVRNNVFVNAYAQALFFNDLEQPSPYAPGTPHQIVNNTFIVPADARYLSGRDSWIPVSVWGNWASPAVRAIVKNNVFRRSGPSATGTSLFEISAESLTNTKIDYNDWGGTTPAWLVGANYRTSFADFRSLVQTIAGAGNESALDQRRSAIRAALLRSPPARARAPRGRRGSISAASGGRPLRTTTIATSRTSHRARRGPPDGGAWGRSSRPAPRASQVRSRTTTRGRPRIAPVPWGTSTWPASPHV